MFEKSILKIVVEVVSLKLLWNFACLTCLVQEVNQCYLQSWWGIKSIINLEVIVNIALEWDFPVCDWSNFSVCGAPWPLWRHKSAVISGVQSSGNSALLSLLPPQRELRHNSDSPSSEFCQKAILSIPLKRLQWIQ